MQNVRYFGQLDVFLGPLIHYYMLDNTFLTKQWGKNGLERKP